MVLFDTLEFAEDVMKNEPVLPIPYEEPWAVNPTEEEMQMRRKPLKAH